MNHGFETHFIMTNLALGYLFPCVIRKYESYDVSWTYSDGL